LLIVHSRHGNDRNILRAMSNRPNSHLLWQSDSSRTTAAWMWLWPDASVPMRRQVLVLVRTQHRFGVAGNPSRERSHATQ